MKLSLADPKYLKESIGIISELVSTGTFVVTKDAIELIAMDSANVAMVIFKLFSTTFVEYEVTKEENLTIDLTLFKQILKRAKSSDILTLELEDNRLRVTMKSNATKTYYVPLLDYEEREQKIPQLEFPLTITTPSALLSEGIEDVDIIGESVAFIADKEKLVLESEAEMSKARVEIVKDEHTKIEYNDSDILKARYSLDYLKKMINAGKLADQVSIQFKTDYPLKLEFKDVDRLSIGFILAPRVDNE